MKESQLYCLDAFRPGKRNRKEKSGQCLTERENSHEKVWKTSEYHIDNTGERLVTEHFRHLLMRRRRQGGILVLEKRDLSDGTVVFKEAEWSSIFEDGAVFKGDYR